MSASAEYMRARRVRLAAERRCVDCTCSLLPEWRTYCPECHEKRRKKALRRERRRRKLSAGYRAKKAASVRASRAKAPDVARQRVYEWRDTMMSAGLCRDCGRADALAGIKRCEACRDKHNAGNRARRAAARKAA